MKRWGILVALVLSSESLEEPPVWNPDVMTGGRGFREVPSRLTGRTGNA